MSKKTAPPDDQSDVEVTPKGEPVDLAEDTEEWPTQDGPFDGKANTADPAAQSDDLDLDKPMVSEEVEPELPLPEPVFTPVNAMEAFEAAMGTHPNSCLKHLLAEWKSQEREARKFEERQRVRGDLI